MSQRVGLVCGAPVMSAIVTGVVAATMLPGLQFAISVNAAIARSGAAIVHTLTSAVERLVTGDDWAQALRFAAGFRSRSFNNTLLIWVQYQAAFEQGASRVRCRPDRSGPAPANRARERRQCRSPRG